MRKLSLAALVLAVGFVFAVSGTFLPTSQAQDSELQNSTNIETHEAADAAQLFERLLTAANQTGAVRVIIGLRVAVAPEGAVSPQQQNAQRNRINRAQNALFARIGKGRLNALKQFEQIPFFAAEVDAATLQQLRADAEVVSVEEDALDAPYLAESTAVVGAPAAWTSGFSGSGQAVAVLDTGVDKNHPFLAGKIVAEGCYSSTFASQNAVSVCPGGVSESTATDSGMNCDVAVSGCAHGTHVAGIAAGRGAAYSGVAKDANIIAMQVFTRVNDATACGGAASCVLSYSSDQIKALERVRALRDTMPVAAVNMSLGGGQFTAYCDSVNVSRKAIIDNLRSVGVATVIASGNNGYSSAMGAPACISSAVSVGSTNDGSSGTIVDSVVTSSNATTFLNLLAPGRWITSSVPNNSTAIYSGTSMAAPHVAGAFAVLKQKQPNASVTRLGNLLHATGQPVTDTRNGIVKSRIRVDLALQVLNTAETTGYDFDGDDKADAAVYRASNGFWYRRNSGSGQQDGVQFGSPGDSIAPADFDGDGRTDVSVYRGSAGSWYRLNSANNTFTAVGFGSAGDLPVPGDFDGDGRADISLFRPSDGIWYRLNSTTGSFAAVQFGANGDKPQIGDFDGDGKSDVTVFRPSNGVWYSLRSFNGQINSAQFGANGDVPAPADYDYDGKADFAVFRPDSGIWYALRSANQSLLSQQFGAPGDVPAPADFDGDNRVDFAVFRPSNGVWYLQRSAAGFTSFQFGANGDAPTSAAFGQ